MGSFFVSRELCLWLVLMRAIDLMFTDIYDCAS